MKEKPITMQYEVAGEFRDGTLELVDEAGKHYLMRMERDEDGLVIAISMEETV